MSNKLLKIKQWGISVLFVQAILTIISLVYTGGNLYFTFVLLPIAIFVCAGLTFNYCVMVRAVKDAIFHA